MGIRGKFGITRDDSGDLANIMEWPWYWRLLSALLIEGATVALVISLANNHQPTWATYGAFCLGTLMALGVAYELFLLLILAAIVWGAVELVGAILPGAHSLSGAEMVMLCGIIYIAYTARSIAKDLAESRRQQEVMAQAIDTLMERSAAEILHRGREWRPED